MSMVNSHDDEVKAIARLEELGPGHVKFLHTTGGLPQAWYHLTGKWLALKEEEERRKQKEGWRATIIVAL